MLEIVLLILKTAGIIFATVLGILIVAVCFVLLVPVRYRGDFLAADGEKDGKKAVNARLRAAWLLHFVRVSVSYDETARVRVKVLFFTLVDTAKEKKRKKGKKKNKTEEKTESTSEEKESGQEIESGREKSTGETDTEKLPDREKALDAEPGKEEISAGEAKDGSQVEEGTGAKQGGSQRQKEPGVSKNHQKEEKAEREKKGIIAGISNILQTIGNFCDKLKRVKEKAEKIEELWLSDHMVSSRSLFWKQLGYLLKHTKPKRLSGYIRFGFDDPAATGYAMALYGILYPIWSPKLSVEPDFENQVLECHILLKGKIRVWHFVRAALRLFISRDVRRVIKDVKKL